MTAALDTGDDTLSISGELDFASVVPLQVKAEQWLRGPAPARCRLSLAGVTRCNSAGIALLLGCLRAAQASGKSLTVEDVPESLLSLLRLAGLEPLLSIALPAA
jgi:phospholipid transport system transporter-binding protein